MKPIIVALLIILFTQTVVAERTMISYKSPDAKRVINVEQVSEAPSFTVTLKEGKKTRWSYHPDPDDKSVRIYWRSDSQAFLMEHVTKNNTYQLFIIDIAKDHVKLFPVTIPKEFQLSSIVQDTISWPLPTKSGHFTLTIQDQASIKLAFKIDRINRRLTAIKEKKKDNEPEKKEDEGTEKKRDDEN